MIISLTENEQQLKNDKTKRSEFWTHLTNKLKKLEN